MDNLFLEDLKDLDEREIKNHLVSEYSDNNTQEIEKQLEAYDVLIAYESVGSWGCDSSSYFLLKHKDTGQYKEIQGAHCSCYGFEGQFDFQDATVEYLKSDSFYLPCGGYDDDEDENKEKVEVFLKKLTET